MIFDIVDTNIVTVQETDVGGFNEQMGSMDNKGTLINLNWTKEDKVELDA